MDNRESIVTALNTMLPNKLFRWLDNQYLEYASIDSPDGWWFYEEPEYVPTFSAADYATFNEIMAQYHHNHDEELDFWRSMYPMLEFMYCTNCNQVEYWDEGLRLPVSRLHKPARKLQDYYVASAEQLEAINSALKHLMPRRPKLRFTYGGLSYKTNGAWHYAFSDFANTPNLDAEAMQLLHLILEGGIYNG